jgi:hypothetical protein
MIWHDRAYNYFNVTSLAIYKHKKEEKKKYPISTKEVYYEYQRSIQKYQRTYRKGGNKSHRVITI